MELHELKKELQNHFTDGLVIIVGCGLSSAEGIPGMWDLAQHLKVEIPNKAKDDDLKLWGKILEKLEKGETIEQALLKYQPTPELEKHIIELTAGLILKEEAKIVNGRCQVSIPQRASGIWRRDTICYFINYNSKVFCFLPYN